MYISALLVINLTQFFNSTGITLWLELQYCNCKRVSNLILIVCIHNHTYIHANTCNYVCIHNHTVHANIITRTYMKTHVIMYAYIVIRTYMHENTCNEKHESAEPSAVYHARIYTRNTHARTREKWPTIRMAVQRRECWISATERFQRKPHNFFDLRCPLST